jgi:CheY-like chemotaxis protein
MSARPIEILLVEDNDDDIIMTLEAFQDAKLVNVVRVLRDGEEALAYLRREASLGSAASPGLVLLDINMPKKGGFEVLDEMKHDPSLQHIPVIMLTTSTREEDVAKSYASGACSYISKPVTMEQFSELAKQFSLYWALVSRIPGEEQES